MILKKLEIHNYGPFYGSHTLEIADEVTVLTGANDVGKSSILNLIKRFPQVGLIAEDDINNQRMYEIDGPWTKDSEFFCDATYIMPDTRKYVGRPGTLPNHSEIVVRYELYRKSRPIIRIRHDDNSLELDTAVLQADPVYIVLPTDDEVGSIFDQGEMNAAESEFLRLAFGNNYVSKLRGLNPINQYGMVQDANRRLNAELSKFFKSGAFRINLDLKSVDPFQFYLGINDGIGGVTSITYRGAGLRKIVTLLGYVLNTNPHDYTYILYDEPENSLHADAQHQLRRMLEEVAKDPTIQVIYSTHSPSMINSMKRESLRLLTRKQVDGHATTVIDNEPYKDNYLPIRVALGMSPVDSLLYAPITLVVEGETEVLCLQLLLKRCYDEGVEGFEKLYRIVPLMHILMGGGHNFSKWVNIAKSQNAKPIVFVDGDKIDVVNSPEFQEKHQDVPAIYLDEGTEFENIVPEAVYFEALAECLDNTITLDKFKAWEEEKKLGEGMMFSKRVHAWLKAEFPHVKYDKPDVMKKAVETVDLSEVNLDKIRELVKEIEKLLQGL